MYIINVTLSLKQGALNDFKRLAETEVLPMLRRQEGFLDQVLCVAPERLEARAIAFWDTKEAAQAYAKTEYPNIVKRLSKLVENTPRFEEFELVYSTLQKRAAKA